MLKGRVRFSPPLFMKDIVFSPSFSCKVPCSPSIHVTNASHQYQDKRKVEQECGPLAVEFSFYHIE